MQTLRDGFEQFMDDEEFVRQVYIYFVNHRVVNMVDPMTTTLCLMANTPLQFTFCEAGLLPFKTNDLPVLPFSSMSSEKRAELRALLVEAPPQIVYETTYGGGKFAVSVTFTPAMYVKKQTLMRCFISAVVHRAKIPHMHAHVRKRFCQVIFQRFLSSVSMPPGAIAEVNALMDEMPRDQEEASGAPLGTGASSTSRLDSVQ